MLTRTGKKFGRQSIKPRRQRFLRLEPLEERRVLAYTSIATATTAVMTGDLAGDTLAFDSVGGNLTHNRFTAGDPGFESDQDFDSNQAGVQTLLADGSASVTVNAGDGDDTIDFANGIVLNEPIDGEGGTDTLDYGDYTTPVAVNLGANAPSLVATLQADQEVPPNDSPATGTATVMYNNVAHTFDITVTVTGIAPAELSGFHIHRQAFGVNGSIIVDFVPGGVPIAPITPAGTGFTFTATGMALNPMHEAALLGGVTYVNVHTSGAGNFPAGEIRGQLFASGPFVDASGTATGTAGISNIERVNGGDAGDGIVGNSNVNDLLGAGGADVIVGAQGNDTMNGLAGDDILAWNNGDGSDVMDGGAAGVETDLVQVNGAIAATDVFIIGAGAGGRIDFDRISPAPFSLDIGAVEQLFVNGIGADDGFRVNSLAGVTDLARVDLNGLDGSDFFQITPDVTVVFNVDGDPDRPPTLPGDFLSVNTAVAGDPALSSTNSTLGKSGSYIFSDLAAVNFREIESLTAVEADISVTKTDSPDPVVAGTNLTYTITVTNNAAEAASVTLTDMIPANTTLVSFTPPAGWVSSFPLVGGTGTATSNIPALAPGNAVFTLVVNVNSNTAQGVTLSNTATVTSTSSDPNPSNNSDTETTTVNARADLQVTKTDTPDPVTAGSNVTYTITLTNAGPLDALGVSLTDVVPANTTLVSFTAPAAWVSSFPLIGGTGTVTSTSSPLAPGNAVFTLVVNVNSSTAQGATLSNTATVTSTSSDANPADNSDTETTAVIAQADLSVTKVDSSDSVSPGTNLTYTITLSNNGSSDAQGVMLSDTTPGNTTFVSATQTAGPAFTLISPAVGGTGAITATAATLAAGATATFTVVVNVNAGTTIGTMISNTASVSSTTTDPTSGNNSETETTNVVLAAADLAVTKTDGPDPVVAGQNLTYTITVNNGGTIDAQNVSLTDVVPANTTFVSALQNSGPAFTTVVPPVGGTGTFSATAATLAAGATATFTVVVNVNANTFAGATISNTASASTTSTDPTPGNNSDTETTAVIAQADLSVTKVDSSDPVSPGTNVTYTIALSNSGSSDAQGVMLSDITPANTTFVSAMQSSGPAFTLMSPAVGGTGAITATAGSLAAGATATFTVVVNVNASTSIGTMISNTASASSTTTDPTSGNNSDTETTGVALAGADLAVTKTDTPDPVVAGQNLTYTITLSNGGTIDAQNVSLTDVVPANTTFVSALQNSRPAFTTMVPPVGGTGTFSATAATLAAGATATFTVVVNVNANTLAGTTLSNTALASTTTTDSTPGNNSETETTAVIAQADLSVNKNDSPDPVLAGTNLTYTITLTNNGPSDAQAAMLSDTVPTNTTFVSAIQTSGPAFILTSPPVGGTGTFSANVAALAAGATATFAIVVNVNASASSGATISNTATASSTATDPNTGNNSDTETTAVISQADLSVTKNDSPDPVAAGANLTYTITVSNAGPSAALNVTLTDVLPVNTTFVSAMQTSGPAFTLTPPPVGGSGTVTATNGLFASGATATFTLIVNVNSGTPQAATISNTATVATTTTDPVAANNTDTETTTVTGTSPQTDVSVTKDDSPDPVELGANITYTITVTNTGSSSATGVSLTDEIPANTTFVSFSAPPGWTTTTPAVGGAGLITATNPTVVAGDTEVFTLVVNVSANNFLVSVIFNTATVIVSSGDSNPANNIDTETTDVGLPDVPGLPECEVITLNLPGDPGTATLEDDADNPGSGVLIVTGTAGSDVIVIEPRPRNAAQLRVTRNGQLVGLFTRSDVQHIVAFGLAGNDKIVVNASLSQPATLFGDAGNDYLYGAKGADGLDGGSGTDRLFGGPNNDTLCGGDGNDFVYGQAGNDFAGGDAGNDKVFGEAGNDFLLGNDGNDNLYGGTGNDRAFGQAGNDQVYGEAGNDIGVGGDGNDKLYGGSGRDVLIGGDGLDTLFGGGHDDILVAGPTSHDEDDEALQAILAEWTSTNNYSTRVNSIRNGGGANGAFVLDDTTIIDDGLKDTLFGDGGLDWYLFGDGDKLKDKASSELVN